MRLSLLVVLAVLAGSAAGAAPAAQPDPVPDFAKLEAMFAYDAGKPLDVKERSARKQEGIEQHDLSYVGPNGRVPAFLLVPEKPGPHAGILLLHGATGTRRSLLAGARILCAAGAVCLLVEAPDCGGRKEMGKDLVDIARPERMRDGIIQLVVELRRAVDLLLSRPDVDPKRLAFIGSSVGGSVGGILAGVEHRVGAYALVSAAGNWNDAVFKTDNTLVKLLLATMSKDDINKALAVMAPLDPMNYIGHAAPAALFFQAGRSDGTTPPECAQAYMDAGSEPKTCQWYEAGHTLDIEAFMERAAWLRQRIGIGAVAEPLRNEGLNH